MYSERVEQERKIHRPKDKASVRAKNKKVLRDVLEVDDYESDIPLNEKIKRR